MGTETGARSPLRAALLVDRPAVPRWAADAIALSLERRRLEIVAVFVRTPGPRPRLERSRTVRAVLGTPQSARLQPLQNLLGPKAETVTFAQSTDGPCHGFPAEVLARAAFLNLDVAIELGTDPLHHPHAFPARHGVLSYAFRGREIGLEELESDAPSVAVAIQRSTGKQGHNEILAEGRFRIERHSYRATLESVLSGSSCLLEKALARCTGAPAAESAAAKDEQPADAARTLRLAARLAGRQAERLAEAGLRRKAWRLLETDRPAAFAGELTIAGDALPLPSDAEFLADPFYVDPESRQIVCERMRKGVSFGDIAHLETRGSAAKPLLTASGRHYSYPYVVRWEDRLFLLPEVADWSAPFLIELDPASASTGSKIALKGLENERLLDPTLLARNGAFWLFASPARKYRQLDTLLLFMADRIDGPYQPHPMNPIVLDPSCARPGGRILDLDGRLLRFGQDNSRGYGAGLSIAEIETLSPDVYRERLIGRIRLAGMQGPHTIDFAPGRMIVDGYTSIADPLAFMARLRPRPFRF